MSSFSLPDVTNLIGGLAPSAPEIVQNIALGAATSVVLSGIKAQMAGGALDPLGLFTKSNTAPANNPNAVTGATVTASAFAALPAATQAQLTAAGVHIVAG